MRFLFHQPRETSPIVLRDFERLTARDIYHRLVDQGVEPTGGTSSNYERILHTEIPKWAEVIKRANIKIDYCSKKEAP